MNDPRTPKAVRETEAMFKLRDEAIRLLDLINAEFQSSPTSTQCFDSRIVKRTKNVLLELRKNQQFDPFGRVLK